MTKAYSDSTLDGNELLDFEHESLINFSIKVSVLAPVEFSGKK